MNNFDFTKIKLNLPEYSFRIRNEGNRPHIFDEIRKKFVALSPEEWVRQNFVRYLADVKKYPPSLMAIEKKVVVNQLPQRFDLLVYRHNGQPYLIAEFKAPDVSISQQSFDQAVRYNSALKVDYIIISNGLKHFACHIDYINNKVSYLNEIPGYNG